MSLLNRDDFVNGLSFGLDDFQIEALDGVDEGLNVLVSAPTGSGKTLVANYAIRRTLAQGSRAFYTTPLKALSNQKFYELANLFGTERVGLLTGDTSINRDADIVVMTTEVLRNMLLTESHQIRDLGLVVLDEVHYLQDPFRGGVWEEVIILTPSSVQFVALSATIGNAKAVGEWLDQVRGETKVVVEQTRPIHLHNHVTLIKRGQTQPELFDLLHDARLSDEARRVDNVMKSTRKFRPGPKWQGGKSSAPPPPFRTPKRSELLHELDSQDLLPAIVFIFSRAACDDAVRQCRRDGLLFTSPEDREQIRDIVTTAVAGFNDADLVALEFGEFMECLQRGLAAHHAGMVPAFREIVEKCFEANLLGAVFATETLALGVNMPARSVVLERFSKFSDLGRNLLTSGEFQQMTGRAGRRGLDDEGHAIVCFDTGVSLFDVGRVALSPAPDLHSSFRPTYNFTANLINHFDYETAVSILRQSYAQFEADRRATGARRPLVEQMQARHHVLEELGYANGWELTPTGQQLRSIYHECDLLIAESLAAGVFDDAEPAILAGVLSSFVYEARKSRKSGPHQSTPHKKQRTKSDRLGEQRRGGITQRVNEIHSLAARVFEVEERYRVRHVKDPDGGFANAIAAWVRGAPLGTALDIADSDQGIATPGDFVRNAKQVADLCEQVTRLSSFSSVVAAAEEARVAILRSVVVGVSVHPRDPLGF